MAYKNLIIQDFKEQGFFTLLDVKMWYNTTHPQRIINNMVKAGLVRKEKMERGKLYPDEEPNNKQLVNIYTIKAKVK